MAEEIKIRDGWEDWDKCQAAMPDRANSALDLSQYKTGDILFWVVLRPIASRDLTFEDEDGWMVDQDTHPKVLFERGYGKTIWRTRFKLPKLHAKDFQAIVDLVTSVPIVEEFDVKDIVRCNNTGEYLYSNTADEWMPQSNLFETKSDAVKERSRIMMLVRTWLKREGRL